MNSQTHSQKFLLELDRVLQEHLSDETLNVKKLTRLVGMSRTDLHRKLSVQIGMSTTKYIRKKRLEKAAELLKKQPEWSIYHVALEVGFENQGYFTTRFKEMYGCCPGVWRAKTENYSATNRFCINQPHQP